MEFLDFFKNNGMNVLCALLILVVGLVGSTFSKRWLRKKIRLRSKDPTVKLFVTNVVYSFLLIVIVISSLTRLGVPTASLLTVLGAGSLAIALSLKDSLSHVASGLIIVGMKLFHIGDVIEINGVLGTVDQINLLNVKIKTPNNDLIIIPNTKVIDDKVCKKGERGIRRLDLAIGISYDADMLQAKNLIMGLLLSDKSILADPAPKVVVKELADSAVLLAVRPWVRKDDYATVLYALTEAIKTTLDENNIVIPYPQVQAHVSYSQPPSSSVLSV